MKSRISYLAYLIGWWVVRTLPETVAYQLFDWMADQVVAKNGKSVRRLRNNLARVQPELSVAALEKLLSNAMRSYMRYWCDTFRIQDWSVERIQSSVTTKNEHLLLDPMRQGRGVVVALPHSGNWDHAGAYFCSLGIPLVTVAEKLNPEALFNKFLKHREDMGFEVLSLDSRSFVTLVQRAKEKRLIALVSDRDLSRSGIDVEFFGFPARMPAGPAVLQVKTGIPLIVAHVSYTDNGIHIDFHAVEVDGNGSDDERLYRLTQAMAKIFEIGIAAYPQDWHMLQRIWIDEDFSEHRSQAV